MCTKQELDYISSEVVESALTLLAEKLYKIILYGSYARGDFTDESDIDIMFLLNCSKEEAVSYRKQINRLASRIGLEHDVMLSISLRDVESFYENEEMLPFYRNILQEGVELYG